MKSSRLSQPREVLQGSNDDNLPAEARPGSSLEYIAAPDGHRIPVRHWPLAQPRAVILIAHGMAEHSGCYADVAARLNAAGYAVITHDHRCHGLAAPQDRLGDVSASDHWQSICTDMPLVNAHARRLYPGKQMVLLGHSMGSFVSMTYAQAHSEDIDALALEGSNYEAPWFCRLAQILAAIECWRQGENGRSWIFHELGFGGFARSVKKARTTFDWLSRDPAAVDRYINDLLCGFQCSNGYWRAFGEGMAQLYKLRNMRRIRSDLPVYLFAGSRDPVGHFGKGVVKLGKVLQKAGLGDVVTRIYEGARHDILHETNAVEITNDLLRWLDQVLPRQ